MADLTKYPTFCVIPWVHLFVSTTGTLRPCCVSKEFPAKHKIHGEGIVKFWNSDDMRNLRKELLSGGKPAECEICWDKELNGETHSKRVSEIATWKDRIDLDGMIATALAEDGRADNKIVSFDLRLGHLCNLKCVMCNPNSSSKWLEDKAIIGKYSNTLFSVYSLPNLKWPKNPQLWDYMDSNLRNIQTLQFAGGEPLLLKEHTALLQALIEKGHAKNVFLKYNSNITILPPAVLEYWKEFKRVDIWSSIDGAGELNDYIRFPSKWNEIVANLHILDNTENINIRVNSAISALNLEFIPELYDFIVAANFKKVGKHNGHGHVHLAPDIVYDPLHLNPRVLPPSVKLRITEKLTAHNETVHNEQYKNQMQYVLAYMNAEDWSGEYYSQLLSYVDELNAIRKNKLPYDIYRPN